MNMHLSRWLAVLALAASSAAGGGEASASGAVETAAQAWFKALSARDLDRVAALTTPDAVLLDPMLPPVSGERAMRDALARALSSSKAPIASATKEITIAGDVAWRVSALSRPSAQGLAAQRHTLEIWKRVNGTWRLHRMMSAGLLTAAQMQPPPPPAEPVLDAPTN